MSWFALAWAGVPALFALVCLGLGLLVQWAARAPAAPGAGGRRGARAMPLSLTLGIGACGLMVITTITTAWGATAGLSGPVLVVLAAAGWALQWRTLRDAPSDHRLRRWGWPLAAAVATYACFAAPAALYGQVTWAGYIKLDDTATWFALADHLATVGRVSPEVLTSTYGVLVEGLVSNGYPMGALAQLGVLARLIGLDVAWVVQPLMASLAAALAASLYALTRGALRSRAWRAGIAVVAAQSALLFGFTLWGGLKEIALAVALAAGCASVWQPRAGRVAGWREAMPLAVAMSAVVAISGISAVVWCAPLGLLALGLVAWKAPLGNTLRWLGAFAATSLVLSVPTLVQVGPSLATASAAGALLGGDDIGNLRGPLRIEQVLGVWLTGDFRDVPEPFAPTLLLLAVVAACAIGGIAIAVERRQWRVLTYAIVVVTVTLASSVTSAAWLTAKVLAVASPAFLLAAGLGAAAVAEGWRRAAGVALGLALAAGVLTSNVMAYANVWLAPSEQMQELAAIGGGAGASPALMLEYNPPGARHFLRHLDAEAAGELRYHPIPRSDGTLLGKAEWADIDEFPPASLTLYNSLVLRNDVASSRPPSGWSAEVVGRFYTVWQRDPNVPVTRQHWPLGAPGSPIAVPPCRVLRDAATAAGPSGLVAVAERAPIVTVSLGGSDGSLFAVADSEASTTFSVPAAGTYQASLPGSFWGRVTLEVDDQPWFSDSMQINWTGNSTPLPPIELAAGEHTLTARYEVTNAPGGRFAPSVVGPLRLSQTSNDGPVTYVLPEDAETLCDRELDWVEAVRW